MNENSPNNNKERNKYDNNNKIEIKDYLNKFHLSQAIKIFNHKPNNIYFKSRLNNSNSEKNINIKIPDLISVKDIQAKRILKTRKYLFLNSPRNLKNEKEDNKSISNNPQNGTKKILLSHHDNKTKYIYNFRKNNSCLNLLPNNNKSFFPRTNYHSKINLAINDKNKLKNEIERANFRINFLSRELYKINIKLKQIIKEHNLIIFKNKIKYENIQYKKQLSFYKLKIFKIKENYIHINKLKENIEKEDLLFRKKKLFLIEKILDLNSLIYKIKGKNLIKKEYPFSERDNDINDNNDMSTDEMLISKNNNIFKINNYFQNN